MISQQSQNLNIWQNCPGWKLVLKNPHWVMTTFLPAYSSVYAAAAAAVEAGWMAPLSSGPQVLDF